MNNKTSWYARGWHSTHTIKGQHTTAHLVQTQLQGSSAYHKPRRTRRALCAPCFGSFFADLRWKRLGPEGKIQYLHTELLSEDVDRVEDALQRLQVCWWVFQVYFRSSMGIEVQIYTGRFTIPLATPFLLTRHSS